MGQEIQLKLNNNNVSPTVEKVGDGNLQGFTATDLTGAANELKNTLTQLDSDLDSEIATRQTYVRPNLLDNWYFVYGKTINNDYSSNGTFPVNQRGQRSYSSSGYTFDRWYSDVNVSINNTGDTVTITNNNNSGAWFRQVLGNVPKETIVGAAFVTAYSGTCILTMQEKGGGYQTVFSKTLSEVGVVSASGQATASNQYNFGFYLSAGASVTFKAMKLEIGSGQTLAHQENGVWVLNEIPNYWEELAKCQRYFLNLSSYERNGGSLQACIGQVYCFDTGAAMIQIPTPVTMAKAPTTIALNGSVVIIASTTKYKQVSNATPTAITKNSNHIYLTINCDLVKGDTGYFQSTDGFTISADL